MQREFTILCDCEWSNIYINFPFTVLYSTYIHTSTHLSIYLPLFVMLSVLNARLKEIFLIVSPQSSIHLFILTLKAPELQNDSTAL